GWGCGADGWVGRTSPPRHRPGSDRPTSSLWPVSTGTAQQHVGSTNPHRQSAWRVSIAPSGSAKHQRGTRGPPGDRRVWGNHTDTGGPHLLPRTTPFTTSLAITARAPRHASPRRDPDRPAGAPATADDG